MKSDARRLIRLCALLVGGMFCFSYLLVPVYTVFCEITGLNGKTERRETSARAEHKVDYSREVKVEFMSEVASGLPWEFHPREASIRIHPGEAGAMDYLATNHAVASVTGRAVPSIAPSHAARFFIKTECFCFSEQALLAGEQKAMPLRFVVDTHLPPEVDTITLSYTFYAAKTDNSVGEVSTSDVSTVVSKGTRG